MNTGDQVVWLDPIVTPALKGGVWVIENIANDIASIRRLDKDAPNQNVQIKNLVKTLTSNQIIMDKTNEIRHTSRKAF